MTVILKPVIALVFAIGFSMTGRAQDIESLLAGMLVLLLAVVAWPVTASKSSLPTGSPRGCSASLDRCRA
jgi:hypothetical protein